MSRKKIKELSAQGRENIEAEFELKKDVLKNESRASLEESSDKTIESLKEEIASLTNFLERAMRLLEEVGETYQENMDISSNQILSLIEIIERQKNLLNEKKLDQPSTLHSSTLH